MAIGYKEQTSSSVPTPATGEQYTFIDSADGKLKKKLDDNSIVEIEVNAANPPASDVVFTPSGDLSSINVQDAITELDSEKAPIAHVGAGGIGEHPVATGSEAGFMSPSDFTKLAGVSAGATANDTDANLKNRANHTGTQAASTISDFDTAADARVNAGILAHVSLTDPHSQYAADSDLSSHTSNTSNPHAVTKAQVGLGNVDNTSDVNKPVSTLQAAADAATLSSAESYTDAAIASLVAASPSQLDTLQELADALGNDANFAATTATALGNRLRVDTDSQGLSSGEKLNAKTNISLENVDNTSDMNKPVSTAQASAIALKANKSGDTFTGPVVVEGDNNGTGVVNLKAQSSLPSTPASGVSLSASADEMFQVSGQSGFSFKLNDQNLTDNRQIDIPDADGPMLLDPTTTQGDIMAKISGVLQRIGIGGEDFILRSVSGIPSWQEENLMQDIGDGSDGTVTLTGSLTAPDNLYYESLSMGPGGVLNPDAYIIYAKTLDLTNAQAGAFIRNGNNGNNTGGTTGAGAAGTAFTARVLGTNVAGGAGAVGTTGNGFGTGTGGNGGAGGNGGKIQLFNITTGVGTLITGSAGSLGSAASGVTGGLGGQGGACVASL